MFYFRVSWRGFIDSIIISASKQFKSFRSFLQVRRATKKIRQSPCFQAWEESSRLRSRCTIAWSNWRARQSAKNIMRSRATLAALSLRRQLSRCTYQEKVNQCQDFGMHEERYLVDMWTSHYTTHGHTDRLISALMDRLISGDHSINRTMFDLSSFQRGV